MSESYLSRCLGEQVPASLAPFLDVKELNYQLLEFCPTADMRQLIEKVFACQFNGALRMLFIEGAMLQLIALKAKLFIEGETLAELNALPDWEAAQIKAAYKMLVSDLTCPPTLSELSCKVNLGERRLNEGFKKLFGDSAFGILRNERLESARRALERGDVPLKQISYRVGYRHTNNFIQAFTKYFGISPTKYKRSLNLDTPDG
ncbi:helix-turn-helix transcriptional regulator [Pseudovibrio denitrificans]|uniref:helix-turn-helix transcriptional regulator n=1 Tax=Pseudovibrio denitrificans TaxID=258256 RepID=UPI0013E2F8B7|nr:AraC family transcriptional regulator [Pseudovibrio denitrificans]